MTDSTPSSPDGTLSNETTILLDPAFADTSIAWPELYASSNISVPPKSRMTTSSLPSPTPGPPRYTCNGKVYGKNLKLSSCRNALSKLPVGNTKHSFGTRDGGNWDANLPFRILSSDGLCALDISHRAGVDMDYITPSELKAQANVLVEVCVKTPPNEGGVVSNIGQNGNLAVRVTSYRPNVHCAPRHWDFPVSDCRNVIELMPIDGKRQIFGQHDDTDPEITCKLPAGYYTRMKRCEIRVDILVPGSGKDTFDWYKLCAYIAFPMGDDGYEYPRHFLDLSLTTYS